MNPPPIVLDAIRKAFPPKDAEKILKDLQYDSVCNYFWFTWAGMHVGVELDGYIHT